MWICATGVRRTVPSMTTHRSSCPVNLSSGMSDRQTTTPVQPESGNTFTSWSSNSPSQTDMLTCLQDDWHASVMMGCCCPQSWQIATKAWQWCVCGNGIRHSSQSTTSCWRQGLDVSDRLDEAGGHKPVVVEYFGCGTGADSNYDTSGIPLQLSISHDNNQLYTSKTFR